MRLPLFSTALLLATVVAAATPSPDGSCAGAKGYTCAGSTFGNCCSQYGWCGSGSGDCNTGCQSAFGSCGTGSTSPPSNPVSTDGSCAGAKGYTCAGSTFGNCCSQSGHCGSSSAYCNGACQQSFGTCAAPPGGKPISLDDTCGGANGFTCVGSRFGDCCSQYGGWSVLTEP